MKTKEEILDECSNNMKGLLESINYSCVGVPYEKALKAMESYASQQTEKYKELVKAYDLFREWLGVDIVKCKNAWDKIKQLKTELGL